MALLALVLAGCTAEPFGPKARGVTTIELMPSSAVTIFAWDHCARITNAFPKPMVIAIPVLYADAWRSFTAKPRKHIEVTPCD
jgi:hypothetical protein